MAKVAARHLTDRLEQTDVNREELGISPTNTETDRPRGGRKGATSRDKIPPDVLDELNRGRLESATLAEALAVDFSLLMQHAFPEAENDGIESMKKARSEGITRRMATAAAVLRARLGDQTFARLRGHDSDTVRGWAAYALAQETSISLEEKLTKIRPLADDTHFGVREWAWLALRQDIALDIRAAVALLEPWTMHGSQNIRRFAIEATRPRGVWSIHIPELKASPELGRPLLDRTMTDPSRYVQDSCANWLNDAAKTSPRWVVEYCRKWQRDAGGDGLRYILRRALRSTGRKA